MKKTLCVLLIISFMLCLGGCNSAKGSFDEETLEKKQWEHYGINMIVPEEEVHTELNFSNGNFTWYTTYNNTKTGKSGVKEDSSGTYTISGSSINLSNGTTLTFDRDENGMVILKWGDRLFK